MASSLTDAFRDHPMDLHHSKLVDFSSLKELPDSYKWTQQDDDDNHQHHHSGGGSEMIPVIDLLDPNAIEKIGDACKSWRVFQVKNHGIAIPLLDDIEKVSSSLFSLPMEQKLKAAKAPNGVSGYGIVRIASFFSKLMWSEGFTIAGSPLEHFRQLWPQDYTQFCGIVEEYQKEMQQLAGKLMWSMLGSLGITKEDIKWADPKSDFTGGLQFNYYPPCPDPDQAMGQAAHTDSTLLTILHQNDTSGLQVLTEGNGWVTVPPIQGGLVIHVGDLFDILSNGLYPSVLHRAVVNRTQHRLSIAYLYGPPSSVQISPLSKLVGPSEIPLYRAVTWTEYLGIKAKHFNKALSWVRVCDVDSDQSNGVNEHEPN